MEERFAIINQEKNPTWSIGGEDIKYNDLSEDTKAYLSEFNTVLLKSQKNGIYFTKSLADLGNAYAKKREELSGQYSGDELNGKLDELEKAFKAFTERKVIGSTGNEPMTMATQARFKIEHAKNLKYTTKVHEAYLKGENMSNVKKRDITSDDKQLFENLMKTANSALNNITEFFNKNSAIKGSEIETLKNYVAEDGSWSLGKLNTVYQLVDNLDNPKLYQYSSLNIHSNDNPNIINSITQFDNNFSEGEKAVYQELYNWNK